MEVVWSNHLSVVDIVHIYHLSIHLRAGGCMFWRMGRKKKREQRRKRERNGVSLRRRRCRLDTQGDAIHTHAKNKFFLSFTNFPFFILFQVSVGWIFHAIYNKFPFFFSKKYPVFFTEYQRGKYKIFFSRWLTQFSQGLQHSSWPEVVTTHMANLADP